MNTYRLLIPGAMVTLLISGCAHTSILQTTDFAGTQFGDKQARVQEGENGANRDRATGKGALTLSEGVEFYDNGDYENAIRKLREVRNQNAAPSVRAAALKYTAFSYCVTENYTLCRQTFDLALAANADFRLLATEMDHPMWGPVFAQAVAALARESVPASVGLERGRWRNVDLWRAKGMSP